MYIHIEFDNLIIESKMMITSFVCSNCSQEVLLYGKFMPLMTARPTLTAVVISHINTTYSCWCHCHEYKPASGHVHQDFISPIQRKSPYVNRVLAKYVVMLSSKTAKLPLLDRHLLTAVNQLTFSSLWIL